MSTPRIQKFLLIWKNHAGKSRYFKLATPADHTINASLRMANGKYLTTGEPLSPGEHMAVMNVHDYVKDSGHVTPLTDAALTGHMGWDRVYIMGLSNN